MRWFVFNYLIGNSDAHAKNIAFLVSPGRIDLAPAYDLLSVRPYGDDYDYMAMSIASEIRYGWIEKSQWDELATTLNISRSFMTRILRELAVSVPRNGKSLLRSAEFLAEERNFLQEVVALIETHAGYVTEALS